MEIVLEYVKPELVIVAVALYFIGMWLKQSKVAADKYIPLVLGVIGIVLSLIWVLATSDMIDYKSVLLAIFTAIVQGVLLAGASTYVNQIWKQLRKKE